MLRQEALSGVLTVDFGWVEVGPNGALVGSRWGGGEGGGGEIRGMRVEVTAVARQICARTHTMDEL